MILRGIERGEVVVVGLDLRALVNLKAHARKRLDHLISDQRVRVEIAARNFRARQRDINLLCLVAVIQLCLSRLLFECGQLFKHPVLQRIHFLAEIRLFLRRYALHLLHESADQAVLPVQKFFPERVQGLGILFLYLFGSLGEALL